jgi:hypothetical protein
MSTTRTSGPAESARATTASIATGWICLGNGSDCGAEPSTTSLTCHPVGRQNDLVECLSYRQHKLVFGRPR